MNYTENSHGNIVLSFNSDISVDNGLTNSHQGEMDSTMELFKNEDGEPTMIEWEVPDMETTEHIGMEYWDDVVQGYDGVFEIPSQAIALLEYAGFKVSEDLKD